MSARRDSWINNYEEVDFQVPYLQQPSSSRASLYEKERMLPDSSPKVSASPSDGTNTPLHSSDGYISPPQPLQHVRMSHLRSPSGAPSSQESSSSSSSSSPESSQAHHAPSSTSAPSPPPASTPIPDLAPNLARTPRSSSFKSFASSPLNPAAPHVLSPFTRPGSNGSAYITRIPSEDSRALSIAAPFALNAHGARGSMVLYRRTNDHDDALLPPAFPAARGSVYSTSGDSFVSLSSDSKYPTGILASERGLVAYAYDPALDDDEPENDEDALHDPESKVIQMKGVSLSWRGIANIVAIAALISGILSLFVIYPVVSFYHDNGRTELIALNSRINSTGQAVTESFDPRDQVFLSSPGQEIDPDTPLNVRTRRSDDGVVYDLVFSDEFEAEGRTFFAGDDAFWEAPIGELYSPEQLITQDRHLLMRSDRLGNKNIGGRLRSKAPFCLGGGFVEVGLGLSGKDHQETQLTYWAGESWVPGAAGHIPKGSSMGVDTMVTMDLGVAAERLASPSTPLTLRVDFVRFYQRKRAPHAPRCNQRTGRPVTAILDADDSMLSR